MTLDVDEVDRCDLSISVYRECLAKKTVDAVLAIEGGIYLAVATWQNALVVKMSEHVALYLGIYLDSNDSAVKRFHYSGTEV